MKRTDKERCQDIIRETVKAILAERVGKQAVSRGKPMTALEAIIRIGIQKGTMTIDPQTGRLVRRWKHGK